MSLDPAGLKLELRPMLRLALPVVLAELGWVAMGVVDTLMVGGLGAEAIGAVGVGRAVFLFVAILGFGILLGLDTLVSQAFGAGKLEDGQAALLQGVYLSVLMAVVLTPVIRLFGGLLDDWGVDARVVPVARSYLLAVSWSALPLFLYVAFRRYLQAVNLVRPIMIALVSANLVNAFANWVLIFGHLGAPALGTAGAGWATLFSMTYMALFLALTAIVHDRSAKGAWLQVPLALDPVRLRALVVLGLPVAVQLMLEVGVFALVTLLAGKLTPAALAAHQIAIVAASTTYMVPLGVSSAAAVRVGQALGRRDPPGAGTAGWTALALGAGFMLLAAAVFVLLPGPLLRLFTEDPRVIATGIPLLYVAAMFQLFDGIQVVATGALRGAGDTRTPLAWNLVGYWVLGLPVGYYLCFQARYGVVGLWIGLSLGLILVGVVLLRAWNRRVRGWPAAAIGGDDPVSR